MLTCLCNYDEAVRREALSIVHLARSLHQDLQRSVEHLGLGLGLGLGVKAHQGAAGGGSGAVSVSSAAEASWWAAFNGPVYFADVLEQEGSAAVQQCFWDFGDWSDLLRQYKAVSPDLELENILAGRGEVNRLRCVPGHLPWKESTSERSAEIVAEIVIVPLYVETSE